MKGRDQYGGAIRMHAPTELADGLLRPEQALRRNAAERQDDLGLEHCELRLEIRRAGGELVGLGVAIAGRPAHDGVADVDLVARQLHFACLEHLREELARAPDERKPLRILVGAGTLADDHELRPSTPAAEDDGRAPLAELALATALRGLFLGGERFGGAEQYIAAQARLGEAEIAVVAQRLAERAQRVRELGALVARGHRRLRGGLAGHRGAEG